MSATERYFCKPMEEYPIAVVPDAANWSENFAFAGFDPKAGIEFFCHIGRWRRDLSLWREIVTIALPDGTVLVHRGIGNAFATKHGPGGGNFSVEVTDPEKASMRLRFQGGARRLSESVLFEGPLVEGPYYRLAFDLVFDGIAPKWDLGKVGHKSEFMGAGHVEQFGRLHGFIEVDDLRLSYDSTINRDHSRGPRVFDSNIRHHWLQGYLDDGTRFQLYEAEIKGKVGPVYSEARVLVDGVCHAATATIRDKLPFSENRALIRAPVRLAFAFDDKELKVTVTKMLRTISIQSTSPNDMYVGRRQEDEIQNTTVLEQGVSYATTAGVQGYGHLERLVPGKLLVDPQ